MSLAMSNIRMYLTGYVLRSWPVRAVYEDGMARVDATSDLGIPAGAEDGRGAGVGVDTGEVVRREREAALAIILDGRGVVEEEGAVGPVESPRLAAEDQGYELEARREHP